MWCEIMVLGFCLFLFFAYVTPIFLALFVEKKNHPLSTWLLCGKSIDHQCKCSFLDIQFHFTDQYTYPFFNTHYLNDCSSIISFWNLMVISNFFIFKNVLALLSISIEIQASSVSVSTDKSARILTEIMLHL